MSTAPSPEEGDTISVTVANKNGDLVVVHPDRPYEFLFLETLTLEAGERQDLTVTVTKTWYSTAGVLEALTVTVTPTNTVSTPEERKEEREREREREKISDGDGNETARAHSPQNRSAGVDESLRTIADELIGDEELSVTDDEESIVGAAKRRASNQGRDPAIDPRLTELE
ncbi:hypothetical protein [Natronoglomus mannanivorans]|uniref:Uncharacterized protein n=1 Tax=Natronoglomus mannanivorans TaxID=2979990 RepID=A0AAP2YZ33_9EURY|nr:hypothetical protein [Halobacteria archaeon AArc-xg1-1]